MLLSSKFMSILKFAGMPLQLLTSDLPSKEVLVDMTGSHFLIALEGLTRISCHLLHTVIDTQRADRTLMQDVLIEGAWPS